jgi:hypothetical protein
LIIISAIITLGLINCTVIKVNAAILPSELVNPDSDTQTDITPVGYVHVSFFVSSLNGGSITGGSINPEPSPIPGGWYAKNEWYNIAATPDTGFRFLIFTGGPAATVVNNQSTPTQFKVTDTTFIVANFNFLPGNLVPEVPLGTGIASATMVGALLLYFILPRKGKTALP